LRPRRAAGDSQIRHRLNRRLMCSGSGIGRTNGTPRRCGRLSSEVQDWLVGRVQETPTSFATRRCLGLSTCNRQAEARLRVRVLARLAGRIRRAAGLVTRPPKPGWTVDRCSPPGEGAGATPGAAGQRSGLPSGSR
jgi:hypothetical protein